MLQPLMLWILLMSSISVMSSSQDFMLLMFMLCFETCPHSDELFILLTGLLRA